MQELIQYVVWRDHFFGPSEGFELEHILSEGLVRIHVGLLQNKITKANGQTATHDWVKRQSRLYSRPIM